MLAVPMKRKPFETGITVRTLLIAALIVGLAAAVVSILDALLLVFLGIFLALVFEIPVRGFMRKTGRGRGLSATIVVLGSAVGATILALILLVPLVGSVRDFLQDLPELVAELRDSDELSSIGDSGSAENVQEGANNLSASVPDAISAILGVAGNAFSIGLSLFTVLFLALFLLVDMSNLKETARSMLAAGRCRSLARRLGAHHRERLAVGDRRPDDRDDRGHDPGPHRLPARLELRRRAGPDRGLPRPDPEHRRHDRGVHPRAGPVGGGGRHGRGDHARGRPRLPAGREQPALADDLRQGREHLAVLRDPRRDAVRRPPRRARRARRRARHRIAAARPAGGHEGAPRADRGDPGSGRTARRGRGART